MSYIDLNGINKSYGDTSVLNNINLHVNEGEFLVLVGESGCGKSTILRLIAGLEEVDQGTIFINKNNVNSLPPSKRDIAMVFQNYALYPHLTVFENMAFGLKQRKTPIKEVDIKVHETASILKINNLLKRRPKELSGGQRQRVALGRAMVRDPKVFLFDEPLSNLDAKLRQEMRLEIKKLHKLLNITMIYVTHDQTEAMTMGDRIAILRNGSIEQIDTPDKIYNNPRSKFVASFIGMPQMNFIEGVINKKEDFIEFKNADMKFKFKNIDQFSNYGSKQSVTMGIRPEHIYNNLNLNDSDNILSADIEIIENMGSYHLIHFKKGESKFSASIENFTPNTNKFRLTFDIEKSHFFNTENNQIIS